MAEEKKKYSLISVDAGNNSAEDQTETASGVTTSRSFVDGEETIIVSSQAAQTGVRESATTNAPASSPEPDAASSIQLHEEQPLPAAPSDEQRPGNENASDNDEINVPFARMQKIIILALIALIVIFFVYFNFLR